MRSGKKITFLYLSLVVLLFLLFRLPGLGSDISNTDAIRWHTRSQNFLEALKTGNLKDTYQHYQPGVTLMWLNSFVKQVSFTYQYNILKIAAPKTLENADFYPTIHAYSKLAIIAVLLTLFVFQFYILLKLYNLRIAVIYCTLLAVEPYVVGLDRWFHLTSLETYFAFASILSILYWNKSLDKKYLFISSLLLVFSVLAKLTTLILAPIFIYILIRKHIKHVILFGFSSLLFFTILFPAFAVDPGYVLTKLFSAATAAVADNYRNDLLTPFNRLFFYDLVLILKLSPITLFILFLSFYNYKKTFFDFNSRVILAVFAFYYISLSIADQKIDRYSLAMIPSIILFCTFYLNSLTDKKLRYFLIPPVFFILFCTYVYYPVYSAYYSPILGSTKGALKLQLYDNSGEFFAQAATYLNSKGRSTSVFIPDGFASFSPFYKGDYTNDISEADYVVSSIDLTRPIPNDSGCSTLDSAFGSKESSVVYIYRCN